MLISRQPVILHAEGVLIAVEGEDGAGKTTAISILVDELKKKYPDRQVESIRAPGGTEISEVIRNGLLNHYCHPETEVMLFMASHNETLRQVIHPLLQKGAIVVTDRFIDSTYAYQGYGRQLHNLVHKLHVEILQGVEADHTVYITARADLKARRLAERSGKSDRLDNEALEFKKRVADGMKIIRQDRLVRDQGRVSVFENNDGIEELTTTIKDWVKNIGIVFDKYEE